MPITDTSPAAQAIQLQIHRSMSGEQRLLLAYEMSMAARELNRARLLREHPEWAEAAIEQEKRQETELDRARDERFE